MTTQIWIIVATFVLFLTLVLSGKAKIHVAVLLIPIILEVTHVLDFKEAWGGLLNSSVIMMASMFVVCSALNKTTLIAKLSRAIIKPGASDMQIMLGRLIPVACFSGNDAGGHLDGCFSRWRKCGKLHHPKYHH